MYYLITKEIYQSKRTLLLLFFMGLIFIFIENEYFNGTLAAAFLTFFIIFTVMTRNEYYEDKNNGYLLLRTLPIKANQIVLSKFLSVIIMLGIYSLFYWIALVLIKQHTVTSDNIFIYVLFIGISIIVGGVFYNLVYKFGSVKAINMIRIIFLMLYFIPGVLIIVLQDYINSLDLSIFTKIGEFFTDFNNVYSVSGLIIFLYFLLYLNAVRLFKNSKAV